MDVDFDRIMNGMARGGGPVGWRRGAGLWETPGQGEMRRVDASYHGVGDEKLGKWIRKKRVIE